MAMLLEEAQAFNPEPYQEDSAHAPPQYRIASYPVVVNQGPALQPLNYKPRYAKILLKSKRGSSIFSPGDGRL